MQTNVDHLTIRHQCPLCCTAHHNGERRLCDSCYRKAFAIDLLGALAVLGCSALIAAAIFAAT